MRRVFVTGIELELKMPISKRGIGIDMSSSETGQYSYRHNVWSHKGSHLVFFTSIILNAFTLLVLENDDDNQNWKTNGNEQKDDGGYSDGGRPGRIKKDAEASRDNRLIKE
eukprot:gene6287-biopygen13602